MTEFRQMSVGDKIIIQAPQQIMVLEVVDSKTGGGMLIYRTPRAGEI